MIRRMTRSSVVMGICIGSIISAPIAGSSPAPLHGCDAPVLQSGRTIPFPASPLPVALPPAPGDLSSEDAEAYDQWAETTTDVWRTVFGPSSNPDGFFTLESAPDALETVTGITASGDAFFFDAMIVVDYDESLIGPQDPAVASLNMTARQVWGLVSGPNGEEWVDGTVYSYDDASSVIADPDGRVHFLMVLDRLDPEISGALSTLRLATVSQLPPQDAACIDDALANFAADLTLCAFIAATCIAIAVAQAKAAMAACLLLGVCGPACWILVAICMAGALAAKIKLKSACNLATLACSAPAVDELIRALSRCAIKMGYKVIWAFFTLEPNEDSPHSHPFPQSAPRLFP